MTDAQIEAAARAIARQLGYNPDKRRRTCKIWQTYAPHARAALAAAQAGAPDKPVPGFELYLRTREKQAFAAGVAAAEKYLDEKTMLEAEHLDAIRALRPVETTAVTAMVGAPPTETRIAVSDSEPAGPSEDMRGAFEQWVKESGAFTDWTRFGNGYAKPLVDRAWQAWRAATTYMALLQREAGMGSSEWMPIETAPQDGSLIEIDVPPGTARWMISPAKGTGWRGGGYDGPLVHPTRWRRMVR
jgi:hypothetical protein